MLQAETHRPLSWPYCQERSRPDSRERGRRCPGRAEPERAEAGRRGWEPESGGGKGGQGEGGTLKRLLAADWSPEERFLWPHALRRPFAGSRHPSPRARSRFRVLRSAGPGSQVTQQPGRSPRGAGAALPVSPRVRYPSAGAQLRRSSAARRAPGRDHVTRAGSASPSSSGMGVGESGET